MPENGKQNPKQFYTKKYQKHIAGTYGYKLVCLDHKFSKPFETYLGEDSIYYFIYSMIKESKYCNDLMKKHFNKELAMTKEGNKDFENSAKCWICDNGYVDNDVDKVRDHCHFTGKCRGSVHGDCNISLKLNNKLPLVFNNSKT